MIGPVKILFLVFIAVVILVMVRKVFRRTPADDRITEEDMLVSVKPKSPNKPKAGSAKLDLPKDQH
jgi:hypothetical protein